MSVISSSKENNEWYFSWRWKLFLVFICVSIIPLWFIFNIMVSSVQTTYQKDRETKLLQSANIIAGNVSKGNYLISSEDKQTFFDEIESKSKEGNFRVLVLDKRGTVVNDSNKTDIGQTMLIPEVIGAFAKNNKVTTHVEQQTVYAAASVVHEEEKVGAVLVVASVYDIFEAIDAIARKLLLFTIIAVLVLVVLVFFISQLMLEPINSFLKVVQKVSGGHLNERIPIKGRDEFTQIAIEFNKMAVKLEQVEKTREEFVSNVSHELKTPLSSIKVLTESILIEENIPIDMYIEFLQDINSEIDRMTFIVNDLLNLVKLDQRAVPLNVKQTDLNKMVEEILRRLYPLAGQKSIELLYEEVRKVSAMVDEMKLSLAISNLVENGIKYSADGGSVKVIVDADHQNAYITVTDTGIGINDDEQDRIFNRFYRVDKTRDRETGGTGLGLAITHSTVLLHKGSIKVISKESEGSTFIVRIPIQRPI